MLPVAELHVHIEGTLEPELLVKLAARNGTEMPTLDVAELRATYQFGDLQSFLNLYYANLRVLKVEADFYDLASAYLARAAAAGVRRAEIFFDPQTHLANGVRLEEVFGGLTAALADGARDHGISADLIVCFLRDLGADAGDRALCTKVCRQAPAEGLRLVAHAGEEGGPDYVREALDELHVERIDHGVRSMEDPELVARLRAEQIPLTVCPLSNVALRVVGTLGDHMLPGMLHAGLLATVNSDDPAYFGGYVDDNLAALRAAFGYDDARLAELARNSFDACFAPEEDKRRWKAEVDSWFARTPA